MFKKLLKWSTIIGAISIFLISLVFISTWINSGYNVGFTTGKFFLEWYKVIGIAFLVSLLGAIIPHILTEERYAFEKFKDSRKVYSLAKTSILYLPEKLANLNYADSIKTIIEAHKMLHLAETFPDELHKHLHWLAPKENTWVSRNYWEIFVIRKTVNLNINNWDNLDKREKLMLIQQNLQLVEDFFGYNNKNWPDKQTSEIEKAEKNILEIIKSKIVC